MIDNLDTLIPLLGGVGAGVAVFKAGTAAVALYESVTAVAAVTQGTYTAVTEGATVAQTIFNTTCKANPILLVASAVAAAGTALAIYASTAGEASNGAKLLAEENQRVCDSANKVSESAEELVTSYADSTTEMQAQAEYVDRLAGKIENLSGKTNISSSETEVLRGYVAELNQIMPDLNLAYDDQAGKLNMTSEALAGYLEKKQEEIQMQAAQEHALELLKKRSELEIEAIKLDNEASAVRGENGEKEMTLMAELGALSAGLTTGNMDYYRSVKTVSEAQDENSEAIENNKKQQKDVQADLEATQEWLGKYGINLDTVTAKTDENTAAAGENTAAMSAAADGNSVAAQAITETYTGMQDKVSEVLQSQMNMFEEFNAGAEITSGQLLENMKRQIDGVTSWADNMAVLADRGVNQGILDKLAEMGPQGSTYVQAFASMTNDQLKEANGMWAQSIDMKEGVDASVQGMIEQYTISLNGGREQVAQSMKGVGVDVSAGLGEGIREGIETGTIAANELGQAVITGAKTTLAVQSPSKVFAGIGQDITAGLANGVTGSQTQAVASIQGMSQQLVSAAQTTLSAADFSRIGTNITSGIQSGIQSGKPSAISAITSVCQDVKTKARDGLSTGQFSPFGRKAADGIASGLRSGKETVSTEARALSDAVEDSVTLGSDTLYSAGYYTSVGLADGISSGESSVINAVASVCAAAVYEAEASLGISSPSKVFAKLGGYTAEGFGIGYESKMADVNRVIRRSMDIPQARKMGIAGNQADDAGIVNLLRQYLPYLKEAGRDVYLYPSRRNFEKDVAGITNSRLAVISGRERGR